MLPVQLIVILDIKMLIMNIVLIAAYKFNAKPIFHAKGRQSAGGGLKIF